ncbi:hypothetical protein [Streptomyces cyaneofuscatus]|uniref:hypothetical protein n=1 Tax=Streptomyces cyaneofuscatus TaxID=66883 RepID=UPI0036496366
MAGSRRRQWRAAATCVLAGSLVALLGACGVVTTKEDRRAAEELADKHFPGQIKAIGARTLLPGTGGSEVTFAVADDRDAVVRLRINADKGTCESRECAGVLTEAVARGRADDPNVVMSSYQWVWRLEPGRIDRQTGYLLFCPEPGERGRCVNSDDAVLVTADERGNPVGKIRIVHDVREGTGTLRLPPY